MSEKKSNFASSRAVDYIEVPNIRDIRYPAYSTPNGYGFKAYVVTFSSLSPLVPWLALK